MIDEDMYVELRDRTGGCVFHGHISKEVGQEVQRLCERAADSAAAQEPDGAR